MHSTSINATACAGVLYAAVSSFGLGQDFDLSWSTIDCGGATFTTGGGFELSGTIGQPDAGVVTGGSFELIGGFWPAAAAGTGILGDFDGDGDVDLNDYAAMSNCFGGPGGGLPAPECDVFDVDASGDVDLLDFAEFQISFGL